MTKTDPIDTSSHQLSPHRSPEIDQCIDRFLATMCETSRRAILELLSSSQGHSAAFTEKRSGEIARLIGLSAATTSEHLRQLTSLGILASRREGNVVYYRICDHMLTHSFQELLSILDSKCTSMQVACDAS